MPTLYIYPKQGDHYAVPLKAGATGLGRAADNDIPLPDPFCSSHHALIVSSDGGFAVKDGGSKNGTFVNGKKILAPTDLKPGDEILIGSVRILYDRPLRTNVELTDAPAPATNLNTIIPMREILAKPASRMTATASAPATDADRMRIEHRIFSVLSEVSQALVLHKPLGELLEHVMDLISAHLSMDRGVMMLKEGNPVQLIPKVIRVNAKSLRNQKIEVSRSIIAMAFDQQLSVLTSDAAVDPRFKARESIIDSGIHSVMCVPLWNNKEIIGIIYADRISFLQEFTEEDLRLLTLLANVAAIKIENAILIEQSIEKEKMERELELAARIQKDFLPKSDPSCAELDIAGKNIPCLQVGGDYYDFLRIDDRRLGITVADVAGKGVSASLLMASLRAALQSEVRPDYRLPDMAVKLNGFVHRSSAINSFITFFFAELDRTTGELAYVNAGHNAPLVVGRDGGLRTLPSTGLCLGMLPEMAYEARHDTLAPGEVMILYTDGLSESRNAAKEEYGADRLADVCRKLPRSTARELMAAIFLDLEAFTGSSPAADDRTLVIVRRIA